MERKELEIVHDLKQRLSKNSVEVVKERLKKKREARRLASLDEE